MADNKNLDRKRQFLEHASSIVGSNTALDAQIDENWPAVLFRKAAAPGFDITVRLDDEILTLETDRGYHDHFHPDQFGGFDAGLIAVFGMVRDLLTRNMRIEEHQVNGKPRKWRLQAYRQGNWHTEATMGMLIWNPFGKKTSVFFHNDILEPRELD